MISTYPVASGLGDIFTDLLGRETKRTDLRSQCGRGTNFTTSGPQMAIARKLAICDNRELKLRCSFEVVEYLHDLHLIGIELGSWTNRKLAIAILAVLRRTILTHG